MKLLEQAPPHLLFADDDPATLGIYKYYCDRMSWTGEFVTTAREIISAVNMNCSNGGRCFDALIADVNFFDEKPGGPRVSGVAAARSIREQYPQLPIVFVTAFNSYLIKDAAAAVHAEIYSKPIDFERLFARIAHLVRMHRVALAPAPGDERRSKSINTSGNFRRTTDKPIELPTVLTNAMSEVRAINEIKNSAKVGH
jgi:DNA-binding response OmpR family regulator